MPVRAHRGEILRTHCPNDNHYCSSRQPNNVNVLWKTLGWSLKDKQAMRKSSKNRPPGPWPVSLLFSTFELLLLLTAPSLHQAQLPQSFGSWWGGRVGNGAM